MPSLANLFSKSRDKPPKESTEQKERRNNPDTFIPNYDNHEPGIPKFSGRFPNRQPIPRPQNHQWTAQPSQSRPPPQAPGSDAHRGPSSTQQGVESLWARPGLARAEQQGGTQYPNPAGQERSIPPRPRVQVDTRARPGSSGSTGSTFVSPLSAAPGRPGSSGSASNVSISPLDPYYESWPPNQNPRTHTQANGRPGTAGSITADSAFSTTATIRTVGRPGGQSLDGDFGDAMVAAQFVAKNGTGLTRRGALGHNAPASMKGTRAGAQQSIARRRVA